MRFALKYRANLGKEGKMTFNKNRKITKTNFYI